MSAQQGIGLLAKRMTGGKGDLTAWAETPPPGGAAGSHWERNIVELAAAGDPRFVKILRQHVERGVIRSPQAQAVLNGEAVAA